MAKAKADRYLHRWTVQSFSSSEEYVVAQKRDTLEFSCSCKAWIFQRKNDRVCPGWHCKHIQAMLANMDRKDKKQLAAEQAELLQLWRVQDLTELPDLGMQVSESRQV